MATIPAPHNWTAGDDATSTVMQTLTDAILFLLGTATSGGSKKPNFRGRQTVAQTLTTAVWTAITMDTEDVDYDNGHSTVASTDQYVAQTTGWHWCTGKVSLAGNATGIRGARFTINGTNISSAEGGAQAAPATDATTIGIADRIFLTAGQILRIEGLQKSGAGLLTSVAASASSSLAAAWDCN